MDGAIAKNVAESMPRVFSKQSEIVYLPSYDIQFGTINWIYFCHSHCKAQAFSPT
jgi:hypothetical protein